LGSEHRLVGAPRLPSLGHPVRRGPSLRSRMSSSGSLSEAHRTGLPAVLLDAAYRRRACGLTIEVNPMSKPECRPPSTPTWTARRAPSGEHLGALQMRAQTLVAGLHTSHQLSPDRPSVNGAVVSTQSAGSGTPSRSRSPADGHLAARREAPAGPRSRRGSPVTRLAQRATRPPGPTPQYPASCPAVPTPESALGAATPARCDTRSHDTSGLVERRVDR
jgi:hypothetical protein